MLELERELERAQMAVLANNMPTPIYTANNTIHPVDVEYYFDYFSLSFHLVL